ncbi:MAG: Hsp70 family protein [Alphaproteobacteria bacterium]|nr:Hsp70 family protein [Alphaproteobacteria bacterium]
MASAAVGIDLGTTFSAIAHVNEHGVPEVLANAEGDRITPSVILFEDDDVIVGTYAKQAATVYPEQVVEFVKRHIGEDAYRFVWKDREYSAEELSHFILAKLKHDAELRLGVPVDRAVITVPAYFNDKQRRATLRAGRMAGLDVLALLNEPTAAAFAYGLQNLGMTARVLVFDLGGGTFDVTVVDMAGNNIDVIATNGDHQLGGKDWDDAIIDHVAQQFLDKHGVDPRTDIVSVSDLRAKAVSAKISLTRRPKVNIFHDFQGHVLRTTLTREEFAEQAATLLNRCEALTTEVLRDAGLTTADIDTVLLAGGSTRMPMVREMLERVFGKAPAADINPDEAVALGAALTAALESARRAGEEAPVDIRTHDVTSHSLGLAVIRGEGLANARIIDKNTRVPAERTREDITTSFDHQTCVDLWLVQGEQDDPLAATVLGHFEFYGIPPRPAGESRLSITYRYNANAIVEVEAMDLASGLTLPYRIASAKVTLQDIAEGRSPRQVIIVADCSGSMYGPAMDEARRIARELGDDLLDRAHQKMAVVACPGGVRQLPTSDKSRIHKAIEGLVAIGATPMADTLERANAAIEPEAGVARFVIVLSDGRLDDVEAIRQQVETLRTQGTTVVTVGVGPSPDLDVLAQLASSPDRSFGPRDRIDFGAGYANLATWAPQGG